ncbi:major facilitator superfamily domain-containing protein [Syncephalis plumigaleata]|nr:major facilitator superfamily domain-containing protein [Syncephalis plumigaleata]
MTCNIESIGCNKPVSLFSNKQMCILIVAYANIYVVNSIYQPFLYNIISDYIRYPTEEMINFYIGCFLAAGAITQSISNLIWGRLSDKFGRKPVLVVNLASLALMTLMMGFGRSFIWLLITSVFSKFGCGSASVIISALGELSSNENKAKVFTYLPIAIGVGNTIGPIMGGLLISAHQQTIRLDDEYSFGVRNPYFLPFSVSALVSSIVCIAVTMTFKETLNHQPNCTVDDPPLEQIVSDTNNPMNTLSSLPSSFIGREHSRILTAWHSIPQSCWIAICAYFGAQFIISISAALKISWGSSSTDRGGLALSSLQFGIIIAFSGISITIFQLFIYVPLQYILGSLELYRKTVLLMAILFFALPELSLPLQGKTASTPLYGLLWVLLLVVFSIRSITAAIVLTTSQIMVDVAASSSDMRGMVVGIAMAIVPTARFFGPLFSGTLWMLFSLLFPEQQFHFNYAWYMLAALCIILWCMSGKIALNTPIGLLTTVKSMPNA